ncbi:MAG: hypothetical protein ACKO40_06555 [Planctomycetaceae bacterium]
MAALAAGGCRPEAEIRPDDIRVVIVPKHAEPVLAASTPAAGSTTPPPDRSSRATAIRYEIPEGWTDAGASGMRLATLLIGDTAEKREVTVIPASGTLESNVARWQKQLDPDADAAAIEAKAADVIADAESIDVDGATATVVLLRSGSGDGEAILGAMLPVEDAAALFVKFRGAAEIAVGERERFAKFVSSIRWKD